MPFRARKDAVTDTLDNAYIVLKESKELLGLAPVPGLSPAISVLLAILDQVKVCCPRGVQSVLYLLLMSGLD